MKKHSILYCLLGLAVVGLLAPGRVFATDLEVTQVNQLTTDSNGNPVGDQWAWVACSKMVLDYYGYSQTPFDIAAFGLGNSSCGTWNYGWGSGTERRSGVPVWVPNSLRGIPTGTFTLKKQTVTLSWQGISEIIQHFSGNQVATQHFASPISADQAAQEINEFRAPFVINLRWLLPPSRAGQPWRDLGGHFVVCFGADSGNLSIHDPWFGTYVKSDATLRSGPVGTIDARLGNIWATTITTSNALDVVFLFDTTGSMGDNPYNLYQYAAPLLDTISTKCRNYRVAVADFKDYPEAPYGDPSDYVFKADLPFTSGSAGILAAKSTISSMTPSGGGTDLEEAVYSGLFNTLSGTGIGAWRANPTRRMIILFGDHAGHEPEPWVGGHSLGDIIPLATGTAPIAIEFVSVGVPAEFTGIAAASGGVCVDVSSSGTTVAFSQLNNTLAQAQRVPQGTLGAIYPTFTVDPVGQSSMASPAKARLIELQKQNAKTKKWSRLRLVTVKDPAAELWTSSRPLAQANYRWRLGFMQPAGQTYLASSSKVVTTSAKVQFEPSFTEFQRTANPPGFVTIVSPPSGAPAGNTVAYQFGSVSGASSYTLKIYQDGKLWRTYTVRAPASDPSASVLAKTVTGHKLTSQYTWKIQALNFDRPSPFDYWWTYSQ